MHEGTIGARLRRPRPRTVRAVLLAAALLLLAVPPVARADFDVTNRWIVTITAPAGPFTGTCTWDFVQSGGTLAAQGWCGIGVFGGFAGSIDPVLGTIVGDGSVTSNLPPFGATVSFTLNGSVAPSGTTISATLTGELAGTLSATLCQNGNLDPGEACDEGLTFNGCCTASCQFKPDGTSCSSNQCQTATSCAAGACVGTPKPTGTVCDLDRNTCTTDACDAGGSCTAGPCSPCCGGDQCTPQPRYSVCGGPSPDRRASVQIKSSPDGKKDRITFTVPRASPIIPAELGDPTTTTDYDLCVFWIDEDAGGMFLAGARAPAGQTCGRKPCWKSLPNGTVAYRNQKLDPDGLAALIVKPGDAGKARVRVIGRGAKLPLPERLGPLPGGELLIEVRTANACWGAFFLLGSDIGGVNSSTELKGSEGYDY